MDKKTFIVNKADGKTFLTFDFLYEPPQYMNYIYKVLGNSNEIELELDRVIDLITETTIVRKVFVNNITI